MKEKLNARKALFLSLLSIFVRRIEYYMIDEDTGDTQEAADSGDRDYQPNIKDNQLLVQFELSF